MGKWQWTVMVCYVKWILCHFFSNDALLCSVWWLGCGLDERSFLFDAQKKKGCFCLSESVELSIFEREIIRRILSKYASEGSRGRYTIEN